MIEIKTSRRRLKRKLDTTRERIRDLENSSEEILKTETEKKEENTLKRD